MANIIVDGFATYGLGRCTQVGFVSANTIPALNMLSGAWAQVPLYDNTGYDTPSLATLPWDPTNTDVYMCRGIAHYNYAAVATEWRRVLPASVPALITSFYFAMSALPSQTTPRIVAFADGSNVVTVALGVTTTGALVVLDANDATLATTVGPVIVAEAAVHIEIKVTPATGSISVYASGAKVLDLTGASFSTGSNIAQVQFLRSIYSTASTPDYGVFYYLGNLILRDTAGTRNNGITGDRRVATLVANADDVAHQGWTPEFYKRFGGGILDLTSSATSMVSAPSSTQTDLGSADFTLEADVRFQVLPTGATKAVIFGKWDEALNKRSYQLYMGGPALDGGALAFRISTDGAAGTVSVIYKYPWQPRVGEWHSLAVTRASGVFRVFADGIQLGTNITSSQTYFAGTALSVLGGQMTSTTTIIASTALDGWMDNFRLTPGVARYTANYTAPSASFPTGSGGDANFASVAWLSTFDTVSVIDESSYARVLTKWGSAAAYAPLDGVAGYQAVGKYLPNDDTFIEANLIAATGILTQSALPTTTKTVTVATKDGTTAAVYTWKTTLSGAAFEVLVGVDIDTSLANLQAAINHGAGEGTLYGTGTTINFNVVADLPFTKQLRVTATTSGTVGNALASTTNDPNGVWGGVTMAGGANIPPYSQFSFSRLPSDVTIIDSITLVQRTWKIDAGSATTQASFVGPSAGVISGTTKTIGSTPTLYFDTIETDPDAPANPLTPTAILNGKVRIDRTA